MIVEARLSPSFRVSPRAQRRRHLLFLRFPGMTSLSSLVRGRSSADPMAQIVQEKSGSKFEAAFLDMVIQHDQEGVKMADIERPVR